MRVSEADRELAAGVAALSWPLDSFGHAEHVRLAWTLLSESPLLRAMEAFRRVLRAYAAHHDAAAIYSETITIFYLLVIRDRMDGMAADHGWDEFRRANPDVVGPSKEFLERWYPGGSAFAEEAKGAFRWMG